MFPKPRLLDKDLPERAKDYLSQAIDSIQSPSGSVILAAAAVDVMLQEKGYSEKNDKLYDRIKKAAGDHVITQEMAEWAHVVRLDANLQRHPNAGTAMATVADAHRVIEFARALGQFLFVLPARVARGRAAAEE